MVFDEIVYAPAGLSYIEKRDFRLNLEHPPIFKYFVSIPLYLSGYKNSYDNISWKDQNQIIFGKIFYFENKNLNSLIISRLISNLITLIFSIFFYFFIQKNIGKKEALISLLFFTFSPDIISNGSLSTSEIYFSLFSFLSISNFYLYLKKREKKYLFLLAFFNSLSLLTKHTGLLLFPYYLTFLLYFFFKKKLKAKEIANFILIIFLFFYTFLWISYLFKNEIYLEGKIIKSKIVPPAYIESLKISRDLIKNRICFFIGETYDKTPFLFYFLTFFLKTPIPILILFFLSFLFKNYKDFSFFYYSFFFFFFALIFFSPAGNHRYLLFIYPIVFIISSSAGAKLLDKIWDKIFLIFLMLFNIISFFRFYPYLISYTNEFIKKKNSPFFFVDSNIDWGQGLKALKKYCKKEKISQIKLSYFGTANPLFYGINFFPLPSLHQELYWGELYKDEIEIIKGEKIAISATNLVNFYQPNYFKDIIDLENPEKIVGGSIFIYKAKDNFIIKNKGKKGVWEILKLKGEKI